VPDLAGFEEAPKPPPDLAEPTVDTTPPSVKLVVTPTTVTTAGMLTFTVTVSDESEIAKVTLRSGSTVLATLDAPYVATMNVDESNNGAYTFTADATDAAGNLGSSADVKVEIDIVPVVPIPTFVAATGSSVDGATTLSLAPPTGSQQGDLLVALLDAQETSAAHALTMPTGWTLLPGFPLHNQAGQHTPYLIPATENHGTWIAWRRATVSEPATYDFAFDSAATARGVVVAYRGVDPVTPIQNVSGDGYYGTGGTNGLGMGFTNLVHATQVTLVATAVTDHTTYTVLQTDPFNTERYNTGMQNDGLNLVVYDAAIQPSYYAAPEIANKQAPSGSSDGFMFSATSILLTPQ
jgi:hypothetical protein